MSNSIPGSDEEIKWLIRVKRRQYSEEDIPIDPKVRELFFMGELCTFYRDELRSIANCPKVSEICNSLVSFVLGEPKRKVSRLRRLSLKSRSKRSNSSDLHSNSGELSPPLSPKRVDSSSTSSSEELKPPNSPKYDIRYQIYDPDSDRSTFDTVPEEIVLHIFSYLDITSTIRCGSVCKGWNEFIKKKNPERIEYLRLNCQKRRHGDPFLPNFKGYNRWTLFKGISDVKEALTKPDQVLKSRKSSRDIDQEIRQSKKVEDGAVTLLLEGDSNSKIQFTTAVTQACANSLIETVNTPGIDELVITPYLELDRLRFVELSVQDGSRNKYLSVFDGVLAIVICIDLGQFDEVFDPQDTTPMRFRLNAQIQYLEQMANNFWMKETPIVLFAYMDQLSSKIGKFDWTSIASIFPDYARNCTETDLVDHITAKMSALSNSTREVYVYRAYGIDTPIIGNLLWGAIRDVVVKRIMSSCTI